MFAIVIILIETVCTSLHLLILCGMSFNSSKWWAQSDGSFVYKSSSPPYLATETQMCQNGLER